MPDAMETVVSYLFHSSQSKSKTLVLTSFGLLTTLRRPFAFAHLFNAYLTFKNAFSFTLNTVALYYST